MLPLGRQTKQEDKQENDSTMSNKEEETPGKAKVMKEQTKETPQIQSKFSESRNSLTNWSIIRDCSELVGIVFRKVHFRLDSAA